MPRRQLGAWLLSAFLCGVGLVDAVLLATQRQWVSAALSLVLLGLLAWILSPAAFPRPPARSDPGGQAPTGDGVVVYWRPGCVFCIRLRWSLGRKAGRATWVNIWADDEAAAFVRGVNDGNETVPTVVTADQARTNPEVSWVRRALQQS